VSRLAVMDNFRIARVLCDACRDTEPCWRCRECTLDPRKLVWSDEQWRELDRELGATAAQLSLFLDTLEAGSKG
jgi:hypothetical protein